LKAFLVLCVLAAFAPRPLMGQEPPGGTANPLALLKDEVSAVLEEAGLRLTAAQEQAIVLMMEDRRRAAEELFGQTMDFRAGPTEGQQVDRARDAIQWMSGEFLVRLEDYLTPEQRVVWRRFEDEAVESGGAAEPGAASPDRPQQTQYVRINNNRFTAEDADVGGRGGGDTEVIQRGGSGEFHGNAQFLIKDESLNARNPFAHNKPPYQERQTNFDFSGPVVPGRLTLGISGSHGRSENVDTIHATTPQGLFDLGIVHPTINRSIGSQGTYQLAEAHSLRFDVRYGLSDRENQGSGGFNLPERASNSTGRDWSMELSQFSTMSARAIYETRFRVNSGHGETLPVSEGVQLNVLDAFGSGGGQNRSENAERTYQFSNLYSRLGERLTLKTGIDGVYRTNRSLSEGGFGGAYTFSSLEAFMAGTPLNYRVTRGDPSLEASQREAALFMQSDLRLTPRLMLMFGARYDLQTNLSDRNNLAPRLSIAYAVGPASVIRAGAGIFYDRLELDYVQTQMRQDGTRQYEIVIDNPSYPDPFQAGTLRSTLPSVRVTDPDLATPYSTNASIAFERTFLTNLLFSADYNFSRRVKSYRSRNLNAPLPDCTALIPSGAPRSEQAAMAQQCRPDPTRGNIVNLESTGNGLSHSVRLSYRHRFSIFNVQASYTRNWSYDDGQPSNIESQPTDSYNLRADWSRTPGARHNFNSTVNARLPLGVFLTGTVTKQADTAYTITTGGDDNWDSVLRDRPPGVERFSETGPGSFRVDLNISKAFFLSGPSSTGSTRTNVNFFANMSNAFNNTNLGRPSGVLTSPNFGRSTNASDPREIEAGLRFQF
jgi:hypothetical protein